MTRLFIRFYLGVLLILITAWFVQAVVVQQRANKQNVRVVEEAMAGGLRLVRDRIDAAGEHDREAILREIQGDFEYPIDIVKIEQDLFSNEEMKRLQEYDQIVFYIKNGAKVATSLANSRDAVSFGSLPRFVGPSQAEVLAGLGLILLLAAMAIAILLRPVAMQLREVERTATAIAMGDLSARVDPSKVPKGQHLANAFNSMADRTETVLRTQRELLQAVSHELRTPLARMRFAIDLVGTANTDQERQQRLESLDAATEEIDELVGELLSYVRMETAESHLELEPIELSDAVDVVLEKYASLNPSLEFDVEQLRNSGIVLRADVKGWHRVIGNLVRNACRFANHRIQVRAQRLESRIAIDVEDDGVGISAADRTRVLEPFVRLDDDVVGGNGGTVGLGLALVKRIVTSHGGEVQIDESSLGGCRIRTIWPE